MENLILGAHSLSAMFTIDKESALRRAMQTTASRGAYFFEIPYLLCKLPWETVAKIANETGIENISLCHFWPKEKDGSSPAGDPLGSKKDVTKALWTFTNIIGAVEELRENDVSINFIDGPTWGGLGWDYTNLSKKKKRSRVIDFLCEIGDMCMDKDVNLAVEFLRPHEDKVIGGSDELGSILDELDHPSIFMHYDIYHGLKCGEDPAAAIRKWSHRIGYLHLHGNDRRAPGSRGDKQDWGAIVEAIMDIESSIDGIPALPEPFGKKTIEECPALGEGLPIPPPFPRYLDRAYKTLRDAGIPE